VIDEEKDDPSGQEEEDVLRERVRRVDVPERVDHRGDHEQEERRRDGVSGVEPGPLRVYHVQDEEP
jgi:hypothetical protein